LIAISPESATLKFVVHVWPFADVRNSSNYDVSRFFTTHHFCVYVAREDLIVWL